MMIEYLEKLVEEKKYAEVVTLAQRLIQQGDSSSAELLRVYAALLKSQMRTGEYEAAINSGREAVVLADELEEWDLFGSAAGDLGVAYLRLGDHESAMQWWFRFLALIPRYRAALKDEAMVWYNLGTLYMDRDQRHAASFMGRAVEAARQNSDERYAHGVRQALIQLHLTSGSWDKIPLLLAKSAHYLRHNHDAPLLGKSRLFHLKLRAEFALGTGRPHRALLVALRGLEESREHPIHQHFFHLIIAKVLQKDCLGASGAHALAARAFANRAHMPAMAADATEFIYRLAQAHAGLEDELHEYNWAVLH